MVHIEVRYVHDRNATSSEDWKYLAQQLAAAYRKQFYKTDKDGKNTGKGPHPEIAAAVDAILRAASNGMGN